MKTLKFKTDIKCNGCLEKVTPHLNAKDGIQHWEVDLKDPDKTLTADVAGISQEELISSIQKAGFKAEPIG